MKTETDPTAYLRLVGVSSGVAQDPGSTEPSTNPELPRPLYVNEQMLGMIEGWAASAMTHGNLDAWKVLQAALVWRNS